jgi:pSer/pThr/pTyr-binding forkhead associated (FHA) protein
VLEIDGPFCTVRDVGSRNGTYVNGRRIESQVLADGDTISIGDCMLRFLARDREDAVRESTQPVSERGQLG